MKTMTKNEFREYARIRNCVVSYSGKLRKFFIKRLGKMDINKIINAKVKII